MTKYVIIADSHNTFGLRNVETGQIDHGGFSSIAWVKSFYKTTFGWSANHRLVESGR